MFVLPNPVKPLAVHPSSGSAHPVDGLEAQHSCRNRATGQGGAHGTPSAGWHAGGRRGLLRARFLAPSKAARELPAGTWPHHPALSGAVEGGPDWFGVGSSGGWGPAGETEPTSPVGSWGWVPPLAVGQGRARLGQLVAPQS